MTQFGKRLIKGLEEAVAITKGEATPVKVYTDVDVAKIRAKSKPKRMRPPLGPVDHA